MRWLAATPSRLRRPASNRKTRSAGRTEPYWKVWNARRTSSVRRMEIACQVSCILLQIRKVQVTLPLFPGENNGRLPYYQSEASFAEPGCFLRKQAARRRAWQTVERGRKAPRWTDAREDAP